VPELRVAAEGGRDHERHDDADGVEREHDERPARGASLG
jgi:hypothetical protein